MVRVAPIGAQPAREALGERVKTRLSIVDASVLAGRRLRDLDRPHAHDLQSALFQSRGDGSDEMALAAIGFDLDRGAFHALLLHGLGLEFGKSSSISA